MATTSSTQQNTGVITSNWSNSESGYDGQMNLNLRFVDAMIYGVVKDATLTAPPANPVDGDTYLIPASPTGTWAGKAGYIARWFTLGATWEFFPAKLFARVISASTKIAYTYNGTAWQQGDICIAGVQLGTPPSFDMFTMNVSKLSWTEDNYNPIMNMGIVSSLSRSGGMLCSRARGTYAAPAPVQAGDRLFFTGTAACYDGSNPAAPLFRQTSSFSFYADENFSTTNAGTKFVLFLARSGQTTVTPAIQIGGDYHWTPGTDNTQNIGTASLRMGVVYAGTGTINTSDVRMKDDIRELDANELAASKELSNLVKLYKFKDSITEKGNAARLHVGLIAQEVEKVLRKYELDPFAYGFLCYDEWDAINERTEEIGDSIIVHPAKEAGNRYSLRYEELLSFIVAGQEQRLAALEAKLGL